MREIFDAFDAEHEGELVPQAKSRGRICKADVGKASFGPQLCKARPPTVCDRTLHVRPAFEASVWLAPSPSHE